MQMAMDEQSQIERGFFSALMNNSSALVVIVDREGRIVRFNQACELTTGYTFEEVQGKHIWDILLEPGDAELVESVFEELESAELVIEHENVWRTKDGERRLIAWSNTAIPGADGSIEYVAATGIDITEHEETENQLRRAQRQLEERVDERTADLRRHVAFETLMVTISANFINLAVDEIDGGIRRALKDVGQFMDVDRSYVFLFSEDGETMDNAYEWCARGIEPQMPYMHDVSVDGLSWSNEILMQGDVLHVPRLSELPPEASEEKELFQFQGIQSLVAVPMVCRGEPIGFVGFDAVRTEKEWSQEAIRLLKILSTILANALERRETDQSLRESRRMLSTLISNLPGMAYRCRNDQHWTMTFVSEGSVDLTGYGPDVLVENREIAYADLIEPEDRDKVWEKVQSAVERREPFEMTYRLNTPEGQKWVWERGQGVCSEDGHLVAVEGFITDISERVLARQNLEQRVAERTHELSTLLDISHNVASTLELEPLVGLILDQLRSVLDYDAASTMLLNEDELEILAYRGPIPQEQALDIRFPLAEADANRAVVQRQAPVIIDDIHSDEPLARALRKTAGSDLDSTFGYLRCWMGVPLIVKDRVLGMLTLDHSEVGRYSEQDAEMAMAFANQVAVAIDNARLYAEIKRHADEIETLFSIQQAITSRLDPDSVLQLIADAARRLTSTDMSGVYLTEGDDLEIAVISGSVPPAAVGYRVPVEDSVAGLSIQHNRAFVVPDSEADPRVHREVADRVGARSFLTVPLLSEGTAVGTIIVANKQPGTFEEADERLLTMLASSAVIGLENARLYQEEQARRLESEQRRRVAEGLRDILSILNSNLSLDRVLDSIVDQSVRLLNADGCVVYRWTPGEERIAILKTQGMPEEFEAVDTFPFIPTAANRAIMKREPFAIPDFGGFKPDVDEAYPPIRDLSLTVREHFRSSLSVPLVVEDEIYGAITLYYRSPRVFSEENVGLAESYANQAALAIENAQLRDQVEEAAVAAERNRLARDLHDAVTQTLFSASLIAEVLPRIWEQDQEEGGRRLQELRELTRGALAEMRTLLLELRPQALQDAALGDLLEQLAESITGRARVPVHVEVDGACEPPVDVKVALYRIAQEALNNVAKHADATEAAVTLRCRSDQMELSICDDGNGFDPQAISADSLGLGIMRERSETIGADLQIDSEIGQGTDIVVVWNENE